MKKTLKIAVSMALALMMLITPSIYGVYDNQNNCDLEKGKKINTLKLSVTNKDSNIKIEAAKYLMMMQSSDNYHILGFTQQEFYQMKVGEPFTVYVFDSDGEISPNFNDQIYVCPLIYNNEIIGTITSKYNLDSGLFNFSMSKDDSYKNIDDWTINKDTGVVGRIGNYVIVTDGVNIDFLNYRPIDTKSTISKTQIYDLREKLFENTRNHYSDVFDVSIETLLYSWNDQQNTYRDEIDPTLPSYVMLDLPHVQQGPTDICGCASWASVLNYRFLTNYTAQSLRDAMIAGNFIESGCTPNMIEYRNFANFTFENADCFYYSSPPSFTMLRGTLNQNRPIMGSWWSYPITESQIARSTDERIYHSINIVGFEKFDESLYVYYLRNPWYDEVVSTMVTNSSEVVYLMNEGDEWNLIQVVY